MILEFLTGVGAIVAARRVQREIRNDQASLRRQLKDPVVRRCLESAYVKKDGFANSPACDRVWKDLEASRRRR